MTTALRLTAIFIFQSSIFIFQFPSLAQPPCAARIRVVEPGGVAALGSGVLVAADDRFGYVLTNWHVVRGAVEQPVAAFPDGFASRAAVVAKDTTWDLALLQLPKPPASPALLAENVPARGESLAVGGYGGAGQWRSARGRVVGFTGPAGSQARDWVVVAASVRPGDSGGPILNERGDVAGILWGCTSPGVAAGETYGSQVGRVALFMQCLNGVCQLPSRTQPIGRPVAPTAPNGPTTPIALAPNSSTGILPVSPPGATGSASAAAPQLPAGLTATDLLKLAQQFDSRMKSIESELTEIKQRKPEPPSSTGILPVPAEAVRDEVARALAARPLVVQILDEQGAVKQQTEAHLGGAPLRLQLVPVR